MSDHHKILVIFLLTLLIVLSPSFAAMTPSDQKLSVDPGNFQSATFTVSSTIDDVYIMNVVGQKDWVSLPTQISVQANTPYSFDATFNVPSSASPGKYFFAIRASPVKGGTESVSDVELNVGSNKVSAEKILFLGDMQPGGSMKSEIIIKNYGSTARRLDISEIITNPSGSAISSSAGGIEVSADSLEVKESAFTLPECTLPGKYTDTVSLSENSKVVSFIKENFNVDEKFVLKTEKNVSRSLFVTQVKMSLKNTGNVKGIAEVTDDVYGALFFSGDLPSSIDGTKYRWVKEIDPCGTAVITYSVDYTIMIVPIVVVILIVILWLILFKFRLVMIYKKIHQEKPIEEGGEFTVSLHVKSFVSTKNVEVRDFVPSVFEVIDTPGIIPVKSKTNTGTELVWRFNSLNAGEERVMDYKIKPMFAVVGRIKIPRAVIIFNYLGKKFMRVTTREFLGTDKGFSEESSKLDFIWRIFRRS